MGLWRVWPEDLETTWSSSCNVTCLKDSRYQRQRTHCVENSVPDCNHDKLGYNELVESRPCHRPNRLRCQAPVFVGGGGGRGSETP